MPATNCFRCRQPLPEGSTFCVSCGSHNAGAALERRTEAMSRANDRISWAERWRNFTRGVQFLRWFR